MRNATQTRNTTETEITIALQFEGASAIAIETGVRMFDHLLNQFAFHSGCGLQITARSQDGILHHLIEDVAIVLGETISSALGERRGIERYGCTIIPMDDALVRAAVDFGGRAFSRTNLRLADNLIEDFPIIMIPHFFSSLASNARIAIHLDTLAGTDPHHCVEAAFKAFARACKSAWAENASLAVPSTKGRL